MAPVSGVILPPVYGTDGRGGGGNNSNTGNTHQPRKK